MDRKLMSTFTRLYFVDRGPSIAQTDSGEEDPVEPLDQPVEGPHRRVEARDPPVETHNPPIEARDPLLDPLDAPVEAFEPEFGAPGIAPTDADGERDPLLVPARERKEP
jgi:hypothetical protein